MGWSGSNLDLPFPCLLPPVSAQADTKSHPLGAVICFRGATPLKRYYIVGYVVPLGW